MGADLLLLALVLLVLFLGAASEVGGLRQRGGLSGQHQRSSQVADLGRPGAPLRSTALILDGDVWHLFEPVLCFLEYMVGSPSDSGDVNS